MNVEITLHHLRMSNTAGIRHVWELPCLPGFSVRMLIPMSLKATSAETIQKVVDRPLVAPPGQSKYKVLYHYSGTGFFLSCRG